MEAGGAPTRLDFDRVTLDNVSRHYGRRRALSRVTATFHAGRVIGLLGPNGAGKSTLLGILATLIAPSAGEVRYGSASVRDAGPRLRGQIGLLAHDLLLYPELSARENLEFFARLYTLPNAKRQADDAIVRARLEGRGDEPVSGFSRGMRQRLALERSLLHNPRLVLLDEPFTGLDDASTTALIERLMALRSERRILLIATHDLDIVQELLDEAAIFRDGKLLAVQQDAAGLRQEYRRRVAAGE